MSRRLSCTKVAKLMIEHGERFIGLVDAEAEKQIAAGDVAGLRARLRDCCEAYGRDVRCYLRAAEGRRRGLEKELERLGLAPSRSYGAGGNVTEFPVSYFKAWHWDI